MKPIWASRASAYGPDTVQNPRLRRSSHLDWPAAAVSGRRGCDHGNLLGGSWIRKTATGRRKARMKAGAVNMAAGKPDGDDEKDEHGRNYDAAERRAVEGQADGKSAPTIEPGAEDCRDHDGPHPHPAEGHQHIRGV